MTRYVVCAVYPIKYAHGCVVLCFFAVMQWFILNSNDIYAHILQGYFTGTGAIVRLPQCQWSKPEGYGYIDRHLTTTKHSKARTVCILYRSASNHTKARTVCIFLVHTVTLGFCGQYLVVHLDYCRCPSLGGLRDVIPPSTTPDKLVNKRWHCAEYLFAIHARTDIAKVWQFIARDQYRKKSNIMIFVAFCRSFCCYVLSNIPKINTCS